jgi:hypothetical protein
MTAYSRYHDCSSVLDTALLQDLPFPFPVAVVTLKTGSQGGLVSHCRVFIRISVTFCKGILHPIDPGDRTV